MNLYAKKCIDISKSDNGWVLEWKDETKSYEYGRDKKERGLEVFTDRRAEGMADATMRLLTQIENDRRWIAEVNRRWKDEPTYQARLQELGLTDWLDKEMKR